MKVVEEADDRESSKTPDSNEWETTETQKKVMTVCMMKTVLSVL